MFKKFKQLWKKYGFEILIIVSIFIIIITALCRMGKKGTWSTSYTFIEKPTRKGPPKESKGEIECRKVLEKYFNKPFPKARPDLLRNPVTGGSHNLELDCYNPELKLAVEYNGIQHYKYSPYFHKNYEAFKNGQYRDYMKKQMCKENGIILIDVPYTVKTEHIKDFLIEKLKKLN